MDIHEVLLRSRSFGEELAKRKGDLAPKEFRWYPYGTLANLLHIDGMLTGKNRDLKNLAAAAPVADIGAADGDLAFFLELLGFQTDIIDYGPTNFNGLRGARLLKDASNSNVSIHEMDLDSHFAFPRKEYGLVFFLGILYHLKNPFYVLESLARTTRYCIISTRTTQFLADRKTDVGKHAVAYLLSPTESNNDPTNYWIFSDSGLRRILMRTSWEILDCKVVGNLSESDPASKEGDQRTFLLAKSTRLK